MSGANERVQDEFPFSPPQPNRPNPQQLGTRVELGRLLASSFSLLTLLLFFLLVSRLFFLQTSLLYCRVFRHRSKKFFSSCYRLVPLRTLTAIVLLAPHLLLMLASDLFLLLAFPSLLSHTIPFLPAGFSLRPSDELAVLRIRPSLHNGSLLSAAICSCRPHISSCCRLISSAFSSCLPSTMQLSDSRRPSSSSRLFSSSSRLMSSFFLSSAFYRISSAKFGASSSLL